MPNPSSRPAPPYSAARLEGCEQDWVYESDGIQTAGLFDPAADTYLICRSAAHSDDEACQRLKHELRLAARLSSEWAVVPLASLLIRDRLVAIAAVADRMRPVDALHLPQPMPIDIFMNLAAGAARALACLHAHQLAHGDLQAAHFLAGTHGGVMLTGFMAATDLDAGVSQDLASASLGTASMAHRAPELSQGGSARPSVRSDLYAVGVTLYEWLTGVQPLSGHSLAAWQHAHAAMEPAAPSLNRQGTPAQFDRILLKLLAKDPGARYSSSRALLKDLQRCQLAWHATGTLPLFEPDCAGLLQAATRSEFLYGREVEKQTLAAALSRVQTTGESELVLISGAAGGGKSALARWMCARARVEGARVAEGKCDQLQSAIPFGPVAQVLRSLTVSLLGEDDSTLARVRLRWLERLCGQGRALAELVPEVEHVLGKTSALSDVSAQQGQARMESALLSSFASLAENTRPVVLFLDDLQWADRPTLALLSAFVALAPTNVLVIGAMREAVPGFRAQLAHVRHVRRSVPLAITEITIGALGEVALAELVAAALRETPAKVERMARAIHHKTGGNPYFAYQLLQTWVEDGVLFQADAGLGWQWPALDLDLAGYADHIIDLMLQRFARLPPAGTEVLKQAACVGLHCDAGLLARLAGVPAAQVAQLMHPFVEAGLIVCQPDAFVFQHDRVLESAYSLLASSARPAAHARVAREMIEHWHDRLPSHAFEICSQIEKAAGQALTMHDREHFVRVLIEACKRAKRASACERATAYIEAAAAMVAPSWWSSNFELAYGVGLLRCECLLASGDAKAVAREIAALLANPMPPWERAAVHRLEAVLHTVQSDYERAISAALEGLAQLGVRLQRHPSPAQMLAAREAVRSALGRRSIESLGELPEMADERMQSVMSLLSTLISSFFVTDGVSFMHVAKMVELSLAHGASAETPYGLSWFGVFIASLYDECEDGLAFGLAAMALIDRHGYEAARIATLVALDQVSVWTRPLSYALAQAQRAQAMGLASGDIGMACYACNHIVSDLLVMGETLPLVEEAIARGFKLTRTIQYLDIELILASQAHFVDIVRRSSDVTDADSNAASTWTPVVSDRVEQANSQTTRFFVWLYGGIAAVYLGCWDEAAELLARAAELVWSVPAHISVSDCHLYRAIALAEQAGSNEQRHRALAQLGEAHDRFSRWARLNPGTFQSKLLLIAAERARLQDDAVTAIAAFESSARAAGAAGFTHEQALAHELAGRLCQSHGLYTAGLAHSRLAHSGYLRWGAQHKAELLAKGLPSSALVRADQTSARSDESRRSLAAWELGMETAQALSGGAVRERLIETLVRNVLVHAGAQYGLLILVRDGVPSIEATGRVHDGRVIVTLASVVPIEALIPMAVLNSVLRARETLVLAEAAAEAPSTRGEADDAILRRSVLCQPLVRGGGLIGALYLENNLAAGVFDERRVAELELLAPHIAIALETGRLYEQLIDESGRRLSAELNLRTARAELVKNAQLTLLATLSASIAHEVNQPLTTIVTSAEAGLRWIDRGVPDIAEAMVALGNIRQEGQRAATIIRTLRTLAKRVPSQMRSLRIDRVVGEVLSMMAPDIQARGVHLDIRLDETVWVDADGDQLQQVVLNLLTNAMDAMVNTPDGRRELSVTVDVESNLVLLRVMDRGHGIDEELIDQIFEPFITTKADGMGMGLAICRSIVEAHGGTLQAVGREGGGTELLLSLAAGGPPSAEADEGGLPSLGGSR